jgi:DNA modification methylase
MDIQNIKPYEKNAKKHDKKQVQQIANSIKEFGFNQPIVIDKDNVVIVGHGRLEAAKLLGLTDVPTIQVNLTEEQAKAYRLADNKLNESEWDMGLVIDELKGLSEEMFDLTGFDKELLIEPDAKDDVIPEDVEPVAKLGDIWQLGKHRVICGDSTDKSSVEKLMDGKKGTMIFTSPPYNINCGMYETYKDNLESREYIDFNINVFDLWNKFIEGITFWNISYNKNSKTEFIDIIYEINKKVDKIKFLDLVVWDKGHGMPINQKDAMTRSYEDIFVFSNENDFYKDNELIAVFKNKVGAYYRKKINKGLTNYWKISTNDTQLDNHKACYPVMLVVKGIIIGSDEKEIVLDPFLGSGTNVIACEKTNRICYGMELDPKYVDVIIKRWEDYTGNKAIKLI